MSSQKLRNIRTYLFRNARALDVARWNYHFEGGSAQAVLKVLACYQNPDGGFGHALEPDIRTPESNPMSTWTATRLLRELDFPPLAEGMIDKILDYLAQSLGENDHWPATVPAHNDAPHAPWFHHTDESAVWRWNPSIELAAFILERSRLESPLYQRAEHIVNEAMADLMHPAFVPQANELSNLCEAGTILARVRPDLLPEGFFPRMDGMIDGVVERDLSRYTGTEYLVTPEFILNSPKSPYYEGIRDLADAYGPHLESTVTPDGYWPIPWTWGEEPLPPDSQRDWRGALILEHMLYLQNFKPDSQPN